MSQDHATILKAFEITLDAIKQVLILASALMTLTVAFLKDILPEGRLRGSKLIKVSLLLLMLSIVGGVWAMLALAGTLAKASGPESAPLDVYAFNSSFPMKVQLFCFAGAMISLSMFGWLALNERVPRSKQLAEPAGQTPHSSPSMLVPLSTCAGPERSDCEPSAAEAQTKLSAATSNVTPAAPAELIHAHSEGKP